MIETNFLYLSRKQCSILKERVFELLESHGVKLDPHPQMFANLERASHPAE